MRSASAWACCRGTIFALVVPPAGSSLDLLAEAAETGHCLPAPFDNDAEVQVDPVCVSFAVPERPQLVQHRVAFARDDCAPGYGLAIRRSRAMCHPSE